VLKRLSMSIPPLLLLLFTAGCASPGRLAEKAKLARLGPAPTRAQVYKAFPPKSLPQQPQIISGMPFTGSEQYPLESGRWLKAQVFYQEPLPRGFGLDDLLFDLSNIRVQPSPRDTFTRVRIEPERY
jgi:hypothetical protein